MYDFNNAKIKEISNFDLNEDEITSFKEQYLLPGIKRTRALLYYKSGFCSLTDLANSSAKGIIEKTSNLILSEHLNIKVPLAKEVMKHIAVSII